MFRKPKKAAITKVGLRRKRSDGEDEEGGPDETELLSEARRDVLDESKKKRLKGAITTTSTKPSTVLHHFEATSASSNNNSSSSLPVPMSQKDLATRTNEHHPTKVVDRGNKLLAGPIKAPTNIRTTCRFDYQPDICKDYKDTGFCGFGDTCIYLHDRGDTLSGWQLEQKWQEQQELKKKKQKEEMEEFMSGKKINNDSNGVNDDDGLPFACYLCRNFFTDPVVTNCGHYFCQSCLLQHLQEQSNMCPVCNKETHGVFHEPTKLLSKKRKVSGRESTWKEFQEACTGRSKDGLGNDDS